MVNKTHILILFIIIPFFAQAQNASVENKLFGLQTGLFGIWGHYEKKVQNKVSLRSEIGFDNGFWQNSNRRIGFFLVPALIAEPRFYYNLDKRIEKFKNISSNSANCLSLFLRYHPDWFVISNKPTGSVIPDFSIIPTWGLRRSIGQRFNFETSLGIGYRFYFDSGNSKELDMNLTVRIEYNFKVKGNNH